MLEPSMGGKKSRQARAQLLLQKLDYSFQPPRIHFFETCVNAIRTIPTLIHSERDPEDVDTDGDDHSYDSITYLLQKLEDFKSKQDTQTNVDRKLEFIKARTYGTVTSNINQKFNQAV